MFETMRLSTLNQGSWLMRQPAETDGKNAQRWLEGNLEEPS